MQDVAGGPGGVRRIGWLTYRGETPGLLGRVWNSAAAIGSVSPGRRPVCGAGVAEDLVPIFLRSG